MLNSVQRDSFAPFVARRLGEHLTDRQKAHDLFVMAVRETDRETERSREIEREKERKRERGREREREIERENELILSLIRNSERARETCS